MSVQDEHLKKMNYLLEFKYITCVGSSMVKKPSDLGFSEFKYITCVGSSYNRFCLFNPFPCLNTSHVSVQAILLKINRVVYT